MKRASVWGVVVVLAMVAAVILGSRGSAVRAVGQRGSTPLGA